jgi:GT2 family glycosyltransferase
MSELSIIIATLRDRDDIEAIQHLDEDARDRAEIIVSDEDGLCAARNDGIERASTDKLVFLDDDAIPHQGYVERATESLEEHPAVAGRVIDCGHPWIGKTISHYNQGDEKIQTTKIVGCNMAFQREVFETVGMFDENIRWGHDEKELAHRLSGQFEITYDPQLAVTHPYSSGFRDYMRKRYRLGTADIYYWKKTGEPIPLKIFVTTLSPKTYLDNSLKGTIAKVPSGFCKGLGRLVGYKRLLSGQRIFK